MYIRVFYSYLSSYNSISMPIIHKTFGGEGGGGGGVGGWGGGGSKYYGHYKMTHPNCRIQDVTSLALFVHLSGLFTSFYFHVFNT